MTEQSHDDIFALCSRFELDQKSYRVFAKREPVTPALNYPEPTVTTPQETATVQPEGEEEGTGQRSRTALRNLWRYVEASESNRKTPDFQDLLQSSIFVYGAAGGVGATTVSATLGRLFAKVGSACAIADDRGESVLPFFFGEQRAVYEEKRYPGLNAASNTAVRILTRPVYDSSITENGTEWLQRSVAPYLKYLDHLIVDVQRGREFELPITAAPMTLLVAVPDLSSLVGARALKRVFSEKADASRLVCVLNKFDSSSTLHAEVRDWFAENFAQVLTLSRSDLLSEALAEGLTIADWKPQSAVASEFLHLLTVVQKMLLVPSYASDGKAVSLCS